MQYLSLGTLIVLFHIVSAIPTGLKISNRIVVSTEFGGVNAFAVETRTQPKTVLFSSTNNTFQWDIETKQILSNSTIPNPVGVSSIVGGVWLDEKYDWASFRAAAVCFTQNSLSSLGSNGGQIHAYNLETSTSYLAYQYNGAVMIACYVDYENDQAWISYGRSLRRLLLPQYGGTWTNSGTRSYPNVPGSSWTFSCSAVDMLNDFIYFGTTRGSIVRIPRGYSLSLAANQPIDPVPLVDGITIGSIQAIQFDYSNGWIFFASGAGIAYKYNNGDWSGFQSFLDNGGDFRTIIVDSNNKMTFWGAQSGKIYRLDPNNKMVSIDVYTADCDQLDCSSPPPLVGSYVNGTTRFLVSPVNPASIYEIELYDCSVRSNCEECLLDATYCGWCVESNSCNSKVSCNETLILDENGCPSVYTLDPKRGSVDGNTVITIIGNQFISDNSTVCRFDPDGAAEDVIAQVANTTTIICVAPSLPAGEIDVQIYYLNRPFTNRISYTYYTCDRDSCDSCYDADLYSECVWCIDEGECGTSCVDNSSSNVAKEVNCPQLVSINPENGVTDGGTIVTINGNYFPELDYQCEFADVVVNASRIDETSITCITPQINTPRSILATVRVLYARRSTYFSSTQLNFLFYRCDAGNCTECLLGFCTWCLESQTCYTRNTMFSCQEATEECPRLTNITPQYIHVSTPTHVTVLGTRFISNDDDNYRCVFSTAGNSSTLESEALRLNFNSLSCVNPVVTPGVSSVSVTYKSNTYADGFVNIFLYLCTGSSCGSCVGESSPTCSWCLIDSTCVSNNSCANESPTTVCPQLTSVSSNMSHINGGKFLNVVVVPLVDDIGSTRYSCSLGTQISPAIKIGNNTLRCQVPPNPAGTYALSILRDGISYTPDTLPFSYYACESFTYDCNVCVSELECKWCLPFSCIEATSLSCPIGYDTNECPVINSTYPDHMSVGSGVDIAVVGGKFVPFSDYECRLGSFSTIATWINFTQLVCNFGNVVNRVRDDLSIWLDDKPYIINTSVFEFYDCSSEQSQNSCDGCSINPSSYCGWCLPYFSCGPVENCQSLGDWTKEVCPRIYSATPSYASIYGNTTLSINGTAFVSSLQYTCKFNNMEVIANRISDTMIQCTTPTYQIPVNSKRQSTTFTTDLAIASLDGRTFSQNIFSFDFLDCNPTRSETQVCGECTSLPDSRCDWCAFDSKCGPSFDCNSFPTATNPQTCPVLISVRPLTGPTLGGTEISVSGSGFINSPELLCSFENVQVPTTFINSTLIICFTPPVSLPGDYEFTLIYQGRQYTTNILSFSFQENLSKSEERDPTLTYTLTGIIGALVLISAILFALLFILKKKGIIRKKLIEPNYTLLAFSGAVSEYYINSQKAEELQELEKILVKPSYTVAVALSEVTPTSDIDSVTKSLVYIFQNNVATLELLKLFITKEVANSESETALFRASSIVSKIASHYHKIVGLRYLWQTLAVAIHELNDLGAGENQEITTKYETSGRITMGSIMAPSSMEVDPTRMEDSSEAAINALQLMLTTQKLFAAIIKSIELMPPELREVYIHIRNEVDQRYHDFSHKAVAGFLFGRFICPAILAPHVHGLLDEPPNQNCQRYLILLSKILQHLAYGTLPGRKEEWMQRLNDFVLNNQDTLIEFVEKLTKQDVSSFRKEDTLILTIPDDLRMNSLAYVHYQISSNQAMVKRYCEEQSFELSVELANILDKLGKPLTPKTV